MIRWPAAKTRGEQGIKAIVLYPMNALVSDRGRRIAEYLHDDARLHQVSAGVSIGGEGSHRTATRQHLVDSRRVLRDEPPDILLTNYKMLDLLLRAEDAPLWAASATSLRYLVLDEFHTYDGAQGTDVAMLLRRLGATLRVAEPGRPLGRVTPVATSAALGGATRSAELRAFAETVFGTPFDSDSVSGEERLDAAEVVPEVDFELGIPYVASVLATPAPDAAVAGSWQPMAQAFLGEPVADPIDLGSGWAGTSPPAPWSARYPGRPNPARGGGRRHQRRCPAVGCVQAAGPARRRAGGAALPGAALGRAGRDRAGVDPAAAEHRGAALDP
ncbi:MAG: DEAD/DEAH box helicase [Pseudonocardiaceae bacterium]